MAGSPRLNGIGRPRPTSFSPPPAARRPHLDDDWLVLRNENTGQNSSGTGDTGAGASVWDLTLDVWDIDDRPPIMQDKA